MELEWKALDLLMAKIESPMSIVIAVLEKVILKEKVNRKKRVRKRFLIVLMSDFCCFMDQSFLRAGFLLSNPFEDESINSFIVSVN